MNSIKHKPGWRTSAAVCAATLASGAALAREPGVLPTIPTGASMGVPIAAPAPVDGVFLSIRSGSSSQSLYDASGKETPTAISIKDTVFQFAFVPGNKLAGGQYRAFMSVPHVDVDVERVATPSGPAADHSSGLGNVEIRPIDVTWETSPGLYFNAGASLFAPGTWSATRLANPGSNFWTFAPSVGTSYLRDGWNASAHLIYFANGANRDNGYRSGDDTQLTMTVMKAVTDTLSLGAVGYMYRQVSDDKNPDGAYLGTVAGRATSTGIGLSATQQLGPVNLNVMYSKDFDMKSTGGGNRIWFNLLIPLYVKGL